MKLYCKIKDEELGFGEVLDIWFDEKKKQHKVSLSFVNRTTDKRIIKHFIFENAYGKSLFDNEQMKLSSIDDWKSALDIKMKDYEEAHKIIIEEQRKKAEEKLIANNDDYLHRLLSNDYGFNGFLHETTINNLIQIISDGMLKSRAMIEEFDDSADYNVIEHTNENVKNCVRFYFYPGTPTNYLFEQNNKKNDYVYIVFKWDLVSLENARFVNGNAGSQYSESMLVRDYLLNYNEDSEFMDWDTIFSRGPIPTEYDIQFGMSSYNDRTEIIRKRNAELNIPNSVSTNYIDKIIFKSEDARERFKELLKDDIILNDNILLIINDTYFS